jgi:hypothetical protein
MLGDLMVIHDLSRSLWHRRREFEYALRIVTVEIIISVFHVQATKGA